MSIPIESGPVRYLHFCVLDVSLFTVLCFKKLDTYPISNSISGSLVEGKCGMEEVVGSSPTGNTLILIYNYLI